MAGAIVTVAGIATSDSEGRDQRYQNGAHSEAPRYRFWVTVLAEGLLRRYGQFVGKDGLETPRLVLVMQHHDRHDAQRPTARTA
jgi:hypothetical protein